MASTRKERSKQLRRSKAAYIKRVTRGEGYMPWQKPGLSDEEKSFRDEIEHRKTQMLESAGRIRHPSLLTKRKIDRAIDNIITSKWGKRWFQQHRKKENYILKQADGYADEMLSDLTPWVGYTFTCPNCYGVKSQAGSEYTIIDWDYRLQEVRSQVVLRSDS